MVRQRSPMNCATAQRLIDRGIAPGSATYIRAELGFHLASCPACRAYQQTAQSSLLATLLASPSAAPPSQAASRVTQPPSINRRNPWRAIATGVAIGIGLLLLLVLIPAVSALLRIRQNVQAYIIPTVVVAPTPAALAPVAAFVPSATPQQPTVTPQPTAPGLAANIRPSALPATVVPTARTLPTQTITPVPLDAILAVGRAMSVTPLPTQVGNRANSLPANAQGARTILLMGVDRRPGETGGTRSDTIIIARLEPEKQRIALLSLPRDLIVPIPVFGYARINAANAYGEQNPQLGGGSELTRQTVSNLLGIPIDNVIQVDFQGFTGAIDAIGGIDIDVPTEIYDPEYPTMDYGYTIAHFLPGMQHMDGERALMYARTRHADSDIMRMRRQQSVLLSVLQRVRSQNSLQQLTTIADVTAALRGYIRTDIPEDQMVSLAWSFRSMAPAQVERYALDETMFQIGVIPGDYYAIVAIPGAIDQLSYELIHGPSR